MNNKEFAGTDKIFQAVCEAVGLLRKNFNGKQGSKAVIIDHAQLGLGRQAGKWRRQTGLAYMKGRK